MIEDASEEENTINDVKDLMSKLNFNHEPKKLPEVLESARFFEKNSYQKNYYRKCVDEGKREEIETLDIINSLRLNTNFPFYSQMSIYKAALYRAE
jgi:hypothetical protein